MMMCQMRMNAAPWRLMQTVEYPTKLSRFPIERFGTQKVRMHVSFSSGQLGSVFKIASGSRMMSINPGGTLLEPVG